MTYPQPPGQQPAHPPVPLLHYPEQPRPLYGPDATAYVVLPTGAAPLHQGVVQAIGPDGQPLLLTQAPMPAYGMPAYQPMPHPAAFQQPAVPQQAAPATIQDYLTPGMVKLLLGTLAVGGASLTLVFLFQAIVAAAAALQTVAIVAAIVFGGIFLSRLAGSGGGATVNNKISIDVDTVVGRRIKMRTPRRWL